MQKELIDRFGKMNKQVENSINFLWLSRLANMLELKSVLITNQNAVFNFKGEHYPDFSKMANFMKIKDVNLEFDASSGFSPSNVGLSAKLSFARADRNLQKDKIDSEYQMLRFCRKFLESISSV